MLGRILKNVENFTLINADWNSSKSKVWVRFGGYIDLETREICALRKWEGDTVWNVEYKNRIENVE